MSLKTVRFFLIAAGCVFVAAAQSQPQAYVVDTCVKAAPGKGLETSAYIREVLAKTAQVRVDEGTAAWYLALSAVVPAGSEARCDYRLVTGYKGFPPEASAERAAADRKKAGITMTPAENAERANAVGHAVRTDYWRVLADVGPNLEKGQYVRLNYEKLKPGQAAEYVKLQTTGWKPFVESLKGSGLGWHLNVLSMPGGTSQRYKRHDCRYVSDMGGSGQGLAHLGMVKGASGPQTRGLSEAGCRNDRTCFGGGVSDFGVRSSEVTFFTFEAGIRSVQP